MKNFLTPHFSVYRVDEKVEFFKEIRAVFKPGDPQALNVKPQYDNLVVDLDKLLEFYKQSRKSIITQKVEDKDDDRDIDINGITAVAKGYLHHFDPAVREASIVIVTEIDKYGSKIADKNYQAETAVLDDLIDLYKNKPQLTAAVNTLHLDSWFEHMEENNNQFKALIVERDAELAEKPKGKTKEYVAKCIEDYEPLITHLFAYSISAPSELHETVRNMINQIIEKYNHIQRRGRKKDDDTPEGE